jgi:hypothetical protein
MLEGGEWAVLTLLDRRRRFTAAEFVVDRNAPLSLTGGPENRVGHYARGVTLFRLTQRCRDCVLHDTTTSVFGDPVRKARSCLRFNRAIARLLARSLSCFLVFIAVAPF